ncbi:hypothetical protein RB195_014029 [Necator americanus]|uniref:SCP domain-containing protein n=1 Tax=Necator americanus TaxID=51031 RepID=A0ABR1DYE6_NECAM
MYCVTVFILAGKYDCTLENTAHVYLTTVAESEDVLPDPNVMEAKYSENDTSVFDAAKFARQAAVSWSDKYDEMRSRKKFGCNSNDDNAEHSVMCLFT